MIAIINRLALAAIGRLILRLQYYADLAYNSLEPR
jgi:hypothetical protein